jgi:hypothetical protein
MNNKTVGLFIHNPAGVLEKICARWGKVRYVRTCRSSTCGCVSHDPGYDEATIPAGPVATYLTGKLKGVTPNWIGSHAYTVLSEPTSRDLRNRDCGTADHCKVVCRMQFLSDVEKGKFVVEYLDGLEVDDASPGGMGAADTVFRQAVAVNRERLDRFNAMVEAAKAEHRTAERAKMEHGMAHALASVGL